VWLLCNLLVWLREIGQEVKLEDSTQQAVTCANCVRVIYTRQSSADWHVMIDYDSLSYDSEVNVQNGPLKVCM